MVRVESARVELVGWGLVPVELALEWALALVESGLVLERESVRVW